MPSASPERPGHAAGLLWVVVSRAYGGGSLAATIVESGHLFGFTPARLKAI